VELIQLPDDSHEIILPEGVYTVGAFTTDPQAVSSVVPQVSFPVTVTVDGVDMATQPLRLSGELKEILVTIQRVAR
jgi:hypothetical protein